jgi:hypothetical protein
VASQLGWGHGNAFSTALGKIRRPPLVVVVVVEEKDCDDGGRRGAWRNTCGSNFDVEWEFAIESSMSE